jgi:hypothetical protein
MTGQCRERRSAPEEVDRPPLWRPELVDEGQTPRWTLDQGPGTGEPGWTTLKRLAVSADIGWYGRERRRRPNRVGQDGRASLAAAGAQCGPVLLRRSLVARLPLDRRRIVGRRPRGWPLGEDSAPSGPSPRGCRRCSGPEVRSLGALRPRTAGRGGGRGHRSQRPGGGSGLGGVARVGSLAPQSPVSGCIDAGDIQPGPLTIARQSPVAVFVDHRALGPAAAQT